MGEEIQTPSGRKLIVGVHADDQEQGLASTDEIVCYLQGWTEEDIAEATRWTHLKLRGKRYRIISPLKNGSLKIQLDE